MMYRFKYITNLIVICVCILLILSGYNYLICTEYNPVLKTFNPNVKDYSEVYTDMSDVYSKTATKNFIGTSLEKTRVMVKVEMWSYNYRYSGVKKLEDLVMESGGTPVRSIIVSTWRSGSSFLGDLINAAPASFYSYEPLITLGTVQITGPPLADRAVTLTKNILTCNFSNNKTDLKKYFETVGTRFQYNKRFWDMCRFNQKQCYDADFTTKFCRLFPFHVVKLIRLRLPLLQTLLEHEELKVKLVLLIRDPRGVMQSRKKSCEVGPCAVTSLCTGMIVDYNAATEILHKYPDRLVVLRYEDLALNLNKTTLQLFKFLRLEPTRSVREFLDAHTNVEKPDIFSTFRVTKDIPFKWIKQMPFSDVQKIQGTCKKAMSLWGYNLAHNKSHMKSKYFHPLSPYRKFLTLSSAPSKAAVIKRA